MNAMKKRLMHGLGMALLLASPIWITVSKPANYVNFAISLVLGILLLVLGHYAPESKPGAGS
jgi:hypothetical protein